MLFVFLHEVLVCLPKRALSLRSLRGPVSIDERAPQVWWVRLVVMAGQAESVNPGASVAGMTVIACSFLPYTTALMESLMSGFS